MCDFDAKMWKIDYINRYLDDILNLNNMIRSPPPLAPQRATQSCIEKCLLCKCEVVGDPNEHSPPLCPLLPLCPQSVQIRSTHVVTNTFIFPYPGEIL